MNKHKTAIIAWANGKELEYKNSYGVWWDYTTTAFSEALEIRIKTNEGNMTETHKARLQKIAELKEVINQLERNL